MSDEFTEGEELHLISVCHLAGFRYVIGVLGAAAHDDSRVVARPCHLLTISLLSTSVFGCLLCQYSLGYYIFVIRRSPLRAAYTLCMFMAPLLPSVPSHLSRNCLTGDYVA